MRVVARPPPGPPVEERHERALIRRLLGEAEERIGDLERDVDGLRREAAEAARAARLAEALAQERETSARLRATLAEAARLRDLLREALDAERAAVARERARIEDVPGARAGEAEALRRVRVTATAVLRHADLESLSRASGVALPRLARLRAIGDLLTLREVDAAEAARLYSGGVRSVAELAAEDPRKLALRLADLAPPGRAEALVRAAREALDSV